MKRKSSLGRFAGYFLMCLVISFAQRAHAQTNIWTSSLDNFWDVDVAWSLNTPPSINQSATLITNATTKIIRIDECTETLAPGSTTISNLVMSAPAGSANTLILSNDTNCASVPQLRVINAFTIRSGGAALLSSNCVIQVEGLSGGSFDIDGNLTMGKDARIIATNVTTSVGPTGTGQMLVAGGIVVISPTLILGNHNCTSAGLVSVGLGTLFVTNGAMNATVDVRSGTLTASGGSLVIDRLVITNACGRFKNNGGAISVLTRVLGAGLDADGDGLPNDWEESHGLNPLSADGDDGPDGDPDGDGFINADELAAGTNPSDGNSYFRIISVTKEIEDVRVTWTTGIGKTNALQYATGGTNGGFTNDFADLFSVTNAVGASTNYLDVGAAGNTTSRYYRVRVVP